MLASCETVPEGEGWAVEVKFDGMRAQVRYDGHRLRQVGRPGLQRSYKLWARSLYAPGGGAVAHRHSAKGQ